MNIKESIITSFVKDFVAGKASKAQIVAKIQNTYGVSFFAAMKEFNNAYQRISN